MPLVAPAFQTCNHCGVTKPLSDFETRPDSKRGYRCTCRDCRRDAKNATNRRWYQAHRAQESEKSALYRQNNRRKLQLANMAYHLAHREQRNAYNREYYRRHRDKLIAQSVGRRKRFASLDYGWQWGARHDVAQFEVWSQPQGGAVDLVGEILDLLPAAEQQWCERFMGDGVELPLDVIESIRGLLSNRR